MESNFEPILEFDEDTFPNIEEMESQLEEYINNFTTILENMQQMELSPYSPTENDTDTLTIMTEIRDNIFDLISEKDMEEIDEFLEETIHEYIETELQNMHKPDFHDIMKNDISDLVFEHFLDLFNGFGEDEIYEDINDYVSSHCDSFFEHSELIPPRSYNREDFLEPVPDYDLINSSIEYIQSIKQPKQRTEEWYNQRYNLITASNAWKAFTSDAQKNSLIYEKARPRSDNYSGFGSNTESSLHWGTKFEALTIMFYEKLKNTKISEFGCIPHKKYDFLGASPDGIILDKSSPLYGRMIEIKNIVNRDITGIPKMEYWIQMQLQMETCNLDYCDFVETRFKLYENMEKFYENEEKYEYRGVILYFINKNTNFYAINNEPHYVFMPLNIEITQCDIDNWIKETKESLKETHSLFETQYWYLDEYSIVLVKRNREWFNSSIHKLEYVWNKIKEYRENGKYEELKPIPVEKTVQKNGPICLIKLDENGNQI